MLSAPNGQPRKCDHELGKFFMPRGYELWRDEGFNYWWYCNSRREQSRLFAGKWAARLDAIAHKKGSSQ
jgi:hypothetical protein